MTDIRILSTKAIVTVEDGLATFERCGWLVRDFSLGSPEPDSFADTFQDVECGAFTRSLDGTLDHTTCDMGHDRHAYGSPEWSEQEVLREWAERQPGAEFDPAVSLAHIS